MRAGTAGKTSNSHLREFCTGALVYYRTHKISTGKILRASDAANLRRAPRNRSNFQRGLPAAELEFLKAGLVGDVVLPGDRNYDVDRQLFNRRLAPRPSALVHCRAQCDVRLCLDALRSHKTQFRIRAGGNCFAGYSASDGVIIDVSGLDDVFVDPETLVATVGAGCRFGKLQAILDDHELHLPLGDPEKR